MEEKTLEQLRQELDNLRKQNLEHDLLVEEEKLQKYTGELQRKEKEKMKEELKEEVRREMGITAKSRITSEETTDKTSITLQGNRPFEEFKAGFIERSKKKGLDIQGRKYEDLLEEIAYRRSA